MNRLAALLLVCLTHVAHAKDPWPTWGGPSGNFHAPGKPIKPWTGNLKANWARPLGEGYSAVSVGTLKEQGQMRDVLFTLFRQKGREFVVALRGENGKQIWAHSYPAPHYPKPQTDLGPGPGPHAAPVLVGDRVITLGVTGILHCLDRSNGKKLWSHDVLRKFGGTILYRGHSPTPVVFGKQVIVMVGGKGHAVVSFNLTDGSVHWQALDFPISHSTPILIRRNGKTQLVAFAEKQFVALDPATGKQLWSAAHKVEGGYIASMPVWGNDNRLFFSSAYGSGSWCVELQKSSAKVVWNTPRMQIHHSNAIRIGDTVYGASGDFGRKIFKAINIRTGKVTLQERKIGRCSLVLVGKQLLVLDEQGRLFLVQPTANGIEILAQSQLIGGQAWTPPTLVGGTLFVRNRKKLAAYPMLRE